MRGLLLRLAAIDAQAEAALRIIAAFDQLIAQHADIGGVVRAAAAIAECNAGLWDPQHSLIVHVGPDGREIAGSSTTAVTVRAPLDGTGGGEVWLYHADGPSELDEIVIERMAATALVVLERTYGHAAGKDGALQALLSDDLSEIERVRAARMLGFNDGELVCAAALAQTGGFGRGATSRGVTALVRDLEKRGEIARAARIGDVFAVLTTAAEIADLLADNLRGGVGARVEVLRAAHSWESARAALRFTSPTPGLRRPTLASVDAIGSAIALASIPVSQLRALPELIALDHLAETPAGRDAIAALDAYLRTGSMRRAATELYLHHTSVAARVKRADAALGYPVDEHRACEQARLALTLWQLKRSVG
jgi:hypothetical protein